MTDRGSELPKVYSPADAEPAASARWDAAGVFHVDARQPGDGGDYCIVIPPPNVTAPLHLGHALNNAIQDVLIRYQRMRGDRALWMPGTDHAGIATQTVVEKRLLSEGTRRLDMGREAFVARTLEWKDEYEAVILDQLREMGASCDWARTRFTMDDMCTTAVRHAFWALFADGLIYRGQRLVNWDPVTRTALADDEVEMEEIAGHMWYLRYPFADGSGHVTVATTRPETMLGDTAVAVNPADPRAAEVRGREVLLPIVRRVIPIVEDDYVVMADPEGDAKAQFASGFLKVTPAHDPNDWDIGIRHGLPVINVMGPDASISDQHGWDDVSEEARPLVGLSREDARAAVVAWFDDHGLLEDVRDYHHSVGHSYRSHVPVEPWLSDQWYVRVTDDRLRGSALRAQSAEQIAQLPDGVPERKDEITGDGQLQFVPERYARTYAAWHDNIRDWCISRQLWWGHQIPVWLRVVAADEVTTEVAAALGGEMAGHDGVEVTSEWTRAGAAHMARRVTEGEIEETVCIPPRPTLERLDREVELDEAALIAAVESAGYVRDLDVLDTWFSSALWPLSTMGWPWPEDYPETDGLLDAFNPTSVLCTAREIITLWVSRMVMFNRYFREGDLPFGDVFIHAMIQDGYGQKMSKSLGNGVDPRDIIHGHGADALRFALVQMTTNTQDVRMPVDMVCPHSGETFTPETLMTAAGHVVAAPVQTSPADPAWRMVSPYGAATGLATPTDEMPLARNTSSKFDGGRNFANKVWNATRFALRRLDGASPLAEPVDLASSRFVDRWIVARLGYTIDALEAALGRYQSNFYADTVYDFIWHDVADRYLEAVKPTVDDDPAQQAVLGAVLDAVLRILHPVCPFVTETLWPHVSEARCGEVAGVELPPSELIAAATWPVVDARHLDDDVLATFERADDLAGRIRTLRSERQVRPRQQVVLHVDAAIGALLESTPGVVEALAGVGEVHGLDDRPPGASSIAFEGSEVLVSGLVDAVDVEAERTRLTKTVEAKRAQVEGFEKRLANPGYVQNAKPELVAETRELAVAARADLAAAEAALAALD